MNTSYRVKYVADNLLDDGHDFVLCDTHADGGVLLCIRRGVRKLSEAAEARVLEEAWAAFRELTDAQRIPEQRVYAAG